MNKLRYFILPALVMLLLASCSKDNDTSEPELKQAVLNLEVNLNPSKSNDLINGVPVYVVDYSMDRLAGLVYVVHNMDDGKFVKLMNLGTEELAPVTAEGVTTLTDELPFGNYYVTLIATTRDRLTSEMLQAMTLDYRDAACQIPNNYIYYKTFEVDCMPPHRISPQNIKENIEVNQKVQLEPITGKFVFLLFKGEGSIPKETKFSIEMTIENLPMAFYLHNAKTLNSSETEALGLKKLNETTTVRERFDSHLIASYYLLANHELDKTPEERGKFTMTYKEDIESNEVTKQVVERIEECKRVEFISPVCHTYIYDLYHGSEATVPISR